MPTRVERQRVILGIRLGKRTDAVPDGQSKIYTGPQDSVVVHDRGEGNAPTNVVKKGKLVKSLQPTEAYTTTVNARFGRKRLKVIAG